MGLVYGDIDWSGWLISQSTAHSIPPFNKCFALRDELPLLSRKDYSMKMIRAFFLLLFCVACVCGCKKNTTQAIHSCRIAVSYDTLLLPAGNETAVTRFFYDNDGRVAYTQFKSLNDSSTRVFIHHDSSVVITPTNPLGPTDTIIMNDKGMPVRIKQVHINDDYYDLFTYVYDAAGLLQSSVYSQASTTGVNLRTSTLTYTFVNGDCTSSTYTDAMGSSTTNYTYYTDKLAQDGDYQRYQSIMNYGAVTLRNKHLLRSSYSGAYVSEYNYTFDNTGKIITSTYRFNNQVFRHTFEYDCSQ